MCPFKDPNFSGKTLLNINLDHDSLLAIRSQSEKCIERKHHFRIPVAFEVGDIRSGIMASKAGNDVLLLSSTSLNTFLPLSL